MYGTGLFPRVVRINPTSRKITHEIRGGIFAKALILVYGTGVLGNEAELKLLLFAM